MGGQIGADDESEDAGTSEGKRKGQAQRQPERAPRTDPGECLEDGVEQVDAVLDDPARGFPVEAEQGLTGRSRRSR